MLGLKEQKETRRNFEARPCHAQTQPSQTSREQDSEAGAGKRELTGGTLKLASRLLTKKQWLPGV